MDWPRSTSRGHDDLLFNAVNPDEYSTQEEVEATLKDLVKSLLELYPVVRASLERFPNPRRIVQTRHDPINHRITRASYNEVKRDIIQLMQYYDANDWNLPYMVVKGSLIYRAMELQVPTPEDE